MRGKLVQDPFDRFVTRRIDIDGKKIVVYDGLFSREVIRQIYEFARDFQYGWTQHATNDPSTSFSVRWVRHLPPEVFAMPFFSNVISVMKRAFAPMPTKIWAAYINFNLFGEIHFPHTDTIPGIIGTTALYYANRKWHTDWQGETYFYEKGEPAYVVQPRPGRLILFDASLVHRGSAPSRESYEPRITIAFKFQTSLAKRRKRYPPPSLDVVERPWQR